MKKATTIGKTVVAVIVASTASMAWAQNDWERLDIGLQNDVLPAEEAQYERRREREVVRPTQPQISSPGVWIYNGGAAATSIQGQEQEQALSQNQNQRQALVSQPVTYVEASPMSASRADQIRKARQEAEVGTETKIVEKLEESRLEDERRRAERLFGDRWDSLSHKDHKPQELHHQGPSYHRPNDAPPVVIVVPDDHGKKDHGDHDRRDKNHYPDRDHEKVDGDSSEFKKEVLQELRSIRKSNKTQDKNDEQSTYYMGGVLGVAEYNGVSNMQGNGAAGFLIGTQLPNRVSVEAGFLYSNFFINEYWKYDFFKEMDQYNLNLAVKYSILSGRFQPVIGVAAGYTHRSYMDRTPSSYYSWAPSDESITTGSVDAALIAGLDFYLTNSFAIAAEYRYSRNVINRSESEFINNSEFRREANTSPVEELDYSTFTIGGKFRF